MSMCTCLLTPSNTIEHTHIHIPGQIPAFIPNLIHDRTASARLIQPPETQIPRLNSRLIAESTVSRLDG